MIVDLDDLNPGTALKCDVAIIGAGAVGMAVAHELMHASRDVILVESGSDVFEPATQALYESQIAGLPFSGAMEGRFRTLGGSMTRWAGQALPLDPLDFRTAALGSLQRLADRPRGCRQVLQARGSLPENRRVELYD